MGLVFYCYISVREKVLDRKYELGADFTQDKYVWLAFLWTMLTMISGTAVVFLMITLLKFVRFKSIIFISALIILSLFWADHLQYEPYERVRDVSVATMTFDERSVIEADHSASYRIVPLIALAKSVEVFSINGLFGNGVDSVRNTLDFGLIDVTGHSAQAATLLGIWYEYGFISFLLFVYLSLRISIDFTNPVSFLLWFMLVFLYTLNVQIPWLALMLLYLTKYNFNNNVIPNR
jgi:hypothetical protein